MAIVPTINNLALMTKSVISCDLHDYLEIACMFAIPISLTLSDASIFRCTPKTTFIDKALGECLKVIDADQDKEVVVEVSKLVEMKALVENHHFTTVRFR